MAKVVNITGKNIEEWIKDPSNVYIAENSIWQIPDRMNGVQYKHYILKKNVKLLDLYGKNLGCRCKPRPCHGDVLVELLNVIVKGHKWKSIDKYDNYIYKSVAFGKNRYPFAKSDGII